MELSCGWTMPVSCTYVVIWAFLSLVRLRLGRGTLVDCPMAAAWADVLGSLARGRPKQLRQGAIARWAWFRRASITSLALWFLILLFGALLHSTV